MAALLAAAAAAAAAAALALASGPAAPAASLAPGTMVVVLADDDPDDAAVDQPFADAVQDALGAANFTALPQPGHSRYIAQVSVSRQQNGIVATRVGKEPASAGVGSWGPTVRVPLGSKKTVLRGLIVTALTVRLVAREDDRLVWIGSAVTVQADGTPVAAKLARAVVAAYPQASPAPVSVP